MTDYISRLFNWGIFSRTHCGLLNYGIKQRRHLNTSLLRLHTGIFQSLQAFHCIYDKTWAIYMAHFLCSPLLPFLLTWNPPSVTGSVHLVPRLLVSNFPIPSSGSYTLPPEIPTPRGFPDPNIHLIRTTLQTQPISSLTLLLSNISSCDIFPLTKWLFRRSL
jgi:hypothetical protein